MKKPSLTYRLSVLTLILFLSNILLPATIAAASLYCNVGSLHQGEDVQNCYTPLDASHQNTISSNQAYQKCSFQNLCNQMGSRKLTNTQAIPQVSKVMPGVFAVKALALHLANDDHPVLLNFQPTFSPPSPPLYLKNSSFLN